LKFVPSNILRLISDEPEVEVICPEGLSIVLPEVVMTVSEYGCTAVYPECGLTELDTNVFVSYQARSSRESWTRREENGSEREIKKTRMANELMI
jgi:hypothetical protein